ncbi:MAG: phosphatase domain-containing protein [Ferruginibacter sp.]
MTLPASYIPHRISLLQKIKIFIFKLFRLHRAPALKMYTGFGNSSSCVIYGHALSLSPLPRKKYRNFFLLNSIALMKLFMVKPMAGVIVKLLWEGKEFETVTEKDGFFKFEWEPANPLPAGTYKVKALLIRKGHANKVTATAESEIIIPNPTAYTFISDIDDTFLISHSSNLRKRLFVLLTENARSRRPFDGAVKHYRLLHGIDDNDKSDNAFFYVSSSEWNLHDYIREFVRANKLPEGVYLLNQMKTFSKLFATGQSNHDGKFTRIVKIIEKYPDRKFVLLGDDSQRDIFIYTSVAEHFPDSIYCIYIRRVRTPEKPHVREKQKLIEAAGVLFCYFANSEEGIEHSRKIGLLP